MDSDTATTTLQDWGKLTGALKFSSNVPLGTWAAPTYSHMTHYMISIPSGRGSICLATLQPPRFFTLHPARNPITWIWRSTIRKGEASVSSKFTCLGHEWRLRVYPGGDLESDQWSSISLSWTHVRWNHHKEVHYDVRFASVNHPEGTFGGYPNWVCSFKSNLGLQSEIISGSAHQLLIIIL